MKAVNFDENGLKPCSRCSLLLGKDCFTKQIYSKNGYSSRCIKCTSEAYFERKRGIYSPRPDYSQITMKTCSKCGESKDLDKFHVDKSMLSGRHSSCKSCVKASSKPKKKKNNPRTLLSDEQRLINKLESNRRHREANKERINKARREKYAADPDKHAVWSKQNKGKVAEYKRKWKNDNKHNFVVGDYARRLRSKHATPKWTDDFDKFIINEMYSLARLRSNLSNTLWNVDHIVPIMSDVVCGLHCPENLQVIPAKYNIVKSNKYWPDMP